MSLQVGDRTQPAFASRVHYDGAVPGYAFTMIEVRDRRSKFENTIRTAKAQEPNN